ncbi:MAG: L-alanine-DL-glutamate epimerase [Candidatus Latescibacteria bacterium]|nr:L-alanine-DL-glutamate epimerase [Candidatus Latescibacterota bacterium]
MNMQKKLHSQSRRQFIKRMSGCTALLSAHSFSTHCQNSAKKSEDISMPIKIESVKSNFEREPLRRPFGFKGGYMSEIWQTAAHMVSKSGISSTGICTQSVLWSDAQVFASYSESGGNALMYAMTEHALNMVRDTTFTTPVDLLDTVLEEVYTYGKLITGNPNLRKTFALNSLVGFDNAAWLLYAREKGLNNFDDMIPAFYKSALSYRHKQVASIPLMAYSVPVHEITKAAEEGYFFMKIKIGQPGTQEEMLKKDKERLSAIHNAIGHIETSHTEDGKLPYYFDANGRYEKKETLFRLLDYAKKIGAFGQIALIEEPFPEELEEHVADIGVRVAADESAHTDVDALKRIQMGYTAIALKAIAKTLSMTLKIAKTAQDNGIPCFCADLTVNPILVDWNKNVAARLAPFPGMGLGLVETNGHQNYKNWDTMLKYHPCYNAPWTKTIDGVFNLDENFYDKSGGIFLPSDHYEIMFKHDKS